MPKKSSKSRRSSHQKPSFPKANHNLNKTSIFNEFLPLDILRHLLQFLTIKDLYVFQKSLQKSLYSNTLQTALFGLAFYDGDISNHENNINWIINSGLIFPSLELKPNNKTFQVIQNSSHILESLTFSDSSGMRNNFLTFLIQCPKLTEISFSDCYNLSSTGLENFFSSQLNLTSIQLANVCAFRLSIASLPTLLNLDLSGNQWVGNEIITMVARGAPQLKKLDISSTGVTDQGIQEVIAQCLELQELKINNLRRISSDVHLTIYRKLTRPHLFSNDPKLNLSAAESFSTINSRGITIGEEDGFSEAISRFVEFLSSDNSVLFLFSTFSSLLLFILLLSLI